MAIKGVVLSLAVIFFLSLNARRLPKDASLNVIEDVHGNGNSSPKSDELAYKTSDAESFPAASPPAFHRVACDNLYEEPTEDLICQEHCLPKGYSYGLCVSKICTCI